MHGFVKFHIVVAIHAEKVFNHIARTLNIHAIGGDKEFQALFVLRFGSNFERIENALHHIFRDFLTDETIYIVESEVNREWSHRCGVIVENLAANFATGTLFHEQSGKFERVGGSIWIDATLEAE